MSGGLFKGFTREHLTRAFNVRFTTDGVVVTYRGVDGQPYREKEFGSDDGRPRRWLGEPRPQIPYGVETLRLGGDVVFVVEGESCAWSLRAAFPGTPVIAVPGASAWRPEWARLLQRFPTIYFSFDNDEAGRKLLDTAWPFLPWARRVRLPDGADTRDVLQLLGGLDAYKRLLVDADYVAAATTYILNHNRRDALRDAA